MNLRFRYLIELCALVGRLSYSLDSGDRAAFNGILHAIAKLTSDTILRVNPPAVVLDDEVDDDEL